MDHPNYKPMKLPPQAGEVRDDVTIEDAPWSPAGGLLRAGVWGVMTATGLAALTCVAAWYAPLATTHLFLRTFLTFVIAAVLFAVVQRRAGMVGAACTTMALVLTALVLVSHHVVFAIHGVPTNRVDLALVDWAWLSPGAIFGLNVFPFAIGGGIGAVIWHRHGVNFHILSDIFSSHIRGT